MDRSLRRHGVVWVGIACGALLLPACSDVSSSGPEIHIRHLSARSRGTESSRALRTERASRYTDQVVPASHLFAPPPVPSAEADRSLDADWPDDGRQPIVRIAPEPAALGGLNSAPRRLPELGPQDAHDIELTKEGPIASASDEIDEPAGLPDADGKGEGEQELDLRRLPFVIESDVAEGPSGSPDPAALPRRLPPIGQEKSKGISAGTSLEPDRDSLAAVAEDPSVNLSVSVPTQAPTLDAAGGETESSSGVAGRDSEDLVEPVPAIELPVLEPPAQSADSGTPPAAPAEAESVDDSSAQSEPMPAARTDNDEAVPATEPSESAVRGPWYAPSIEGPTTLPDEPSSEELSDGESQDGDLRRLPPVDIEQRQAIDHAQQLEVPTFGEVEEFAVDEGSEQQLAAEPAEVGDQRSRGDAGSDFVVPLETSLPSSDRAEAPVTIVSSEPTPGESYSAVTLPVDQEPAARGFVPVSVPVTVRVEPGTVLARPHDVTFDVVTRRVAMLARRAEDLASRGAYFAARAEMIKALRSITQALDAQLGVDTHSEALGRAMRAVEEAGDFAPRGSQLESDLNLVQMVSGHRTTILKNTALEGLTPLVAQQRYLEYAQQQFTVAGGQLRASSYALYGLARVYTAMEYARLETQTLCLPTAVTLHQAALLVDASNVKAANELGVLLARFGQWEDARRVLQHALSIQGEPEIWHNMAVVHQQLGDPEQARQALQQYQRVAARQSLDPQPAVKDNVQWVDVKTFSEVAPGPSP